ncbi:MAG: hypothetical protein U1A77_03425 [Pirellulales bacterium]
MPYVSRRSPTVPLAGLVFLFLGMSLGLTRGARGDEEYSVAGLMDSAELRKFVESLALKHIPAHYEDTREWGKTKHVQTGLKVSLDGLRIDSERRMREVNHGNWQRYRIDRHPGPDSLQLVVERVEQKEDGKLRLELSCRAKLFVTGRMAQWERGVQLLSVGMEGDADVRLQAGCDIAVVLDPLKLPPDVTIKPVVTDARLELFDFRLRRVGHLHGPVTRQLGEGMEEVLQSRLREENVQLANKLNRAIAKKQDRLRFSFSDWATRKWEMLAK